MSLNVDLPRLAEDLAVKNADDRYIGTAAHAAEWLLLQVQTKGDTSRLQPDRQDGAM